MTKKWRQMQKKKGNCSCSSSTLISIESEFKCTLYFRTSCTLHQHKLEVTYELDVLVTFKFHGAGL